MNFLVNRYVDDLGKAIRFYSSAFGLRVGRSFVNFGRGLPSRSTLDT
jgi:catechol 2,3-dioxygenase-like lactoylglutathione lyase family enzyme